MPAHHAFHYVRGSKQIGVIPQGSLPAVNDSVALKGTMKSAAIIGGQSLGLRVAEIQRLR